MGRRIRWRWEPINMVEAAALVAAAGCLLAAAGARWAGVAAGLPAGLEPVPPGGQVLSGGARWPWLGLALYTWLRRWVPGGEGREPGGPWAGVSPPARPPRESSAAARAGSPPADPLPARGGKGPWVWAGLLAVFGAAAWAGSTPGGAAPGWAALGRWLAAPTAMPWPVAAALGLMLFQAYRRDGRLRRWALALALAAAVLLVAASGWWLGPPGLDRTAPPRVSSAVGPALPLAFWSAVGIFNAVYTGRSRLVPGARAAAPKPAVVISGFYGAGNTGDEAILASMLGVLRRRGYRDITVLSIRPEETARRYGVHSLYRGWRRAWLGKAWALLRAGIFISGGGGLLQDTTPTFLLRGPVPYYLLIAAWARLSGCWVLFLGQGVGPLRGRWARWLTRQVANHADVITVRDRGSLELLAEVGVTRPPCQLLADWVFAGTPADSQRAERVAHQEGLAAGAYRVVVSVRRWPGDDRFYPQLAAFLRRLLAARPDGEVVLVPMEGELDREASLRLLSWMVDAGHQGADGAGAGARERAGGSSPPWRSRVRVLGTHWQPADLEALVASASLAVGMRLHFLLFAARAGVPVLALNYDPKVAQAMDLLGCGAFVFDLDQVRADALERAWHRAEGMRAELAAALPARAARLAQLAEANVDYVDAAACRIAGAC